MNVWKGRKTSYESVSGGITNPNFKVNVDGTDFIDRENCHMANAIAEKTGVGPKVYYYLADTGAEIFE